MRKPLFTLTLIVLCFNLLAQDSAYYYTAFNSKDLVLKAALNNIIKGHTEFPYTSSSTDVWDILKETDRDTLDATKIVLLYSNRSVDAAQEYNNGNGWNREHVWAKSRGDFGTSKGPGTDLHHLRPCDVSVNSTRNNRNFDDCLNCVDVIDGGVNTGSKRDANFYTFQPPLNVQGDVARMIFYMAVRYEGDNGEPDLELTNTLLTNTDKSPLHAFKSTLLKWHKLDPVSNWERNRNQVIFSYQGNKNPFIDYPELADYLWGDSIGMVWKPLSNVSMDENRSVNPVFFPNPTKDYIEVSCLNKPNSVRVINALGQTVYYQEPQSANFKVELHQENAGMYILEINFNGDYWRDKIYVIHK